MHVVFTSKMIWSQIKNAAIRMEQEKSTHRKEEEVNRSQGGVLFYTTAHEYCTSATDAFWTCTASAVTAETSVWSMEASDSSFDV